MLFLMERVQIFIKKKEALLQKMSIHAKTYTKKDYFSIKDECIVGI